MWSDEHEQNVINLLKKGKTGQTLPRNDYHVLQTYDLVSMGGVEQVARKSNGKYMTTRTRALNVIQLLHRETGHGGENKTFKKIKSTYDNITRNLVSKYIKQCERCCENRKRKETASGVVVKPILVKEFNERGQVDLVT